MAVVDTMAATAEVEVAAQARTVGAAEEVAMAVVVEAVLRVAGRAAVASVGVSKEEVGGAATRSSRRACWSSRGEGGSCSFRAAGRTTTHRCPWRRAGVRASRCGSGATVTCDSDATVDSSREYIINRH